MPHKLCLTSIAWRTEIFQNKVSIGKHLPDFIWFWNIYLAIKVTKYRYNRKKKKEQVRGLLAGRGKERGKQALQEHRQQMQSSLTWSISKKSIMLDVHDKNNKNTHPNTWTSQESFCLPQKNRAKFIQLGFTCDSNKKSVFLFQKLNYYTTALGMWSDHWHFIYKKNKSRQNSTVVSFRSRFSTRKELCFHKIPWRFMEVTGTP